MRSAPVLLDFLNTKSQEHFDEVKRILSSEGITFVVDPTMVRGLDYYTGTTFEFDHADLGAQSGIGGGGRYDGLMETLGGQSLSGIGFGLGVDRIVLAMEAEKVTPNDRNYLDLFVIPLGEAAKSQGFSMVEKMRSAGFVADLAFGERALKGAMKAADQRNARFVLVLGDNEVSSGTAELKRMSDGSTSSVTLASLVDALRDLSA